MRLAGEALHIASGCQLAGFSHVVGTLWESEDNAYVKVSTEFYQSLFDENDGNESHRKFAIALHQAVVKLRDESRNQPLTWAPFIHLGA